VPIISVRDYFSFIFSLRLNLCFAILILRFSGY
jgi:hypothetical protein